MPHERSLPATLGGLTLCLLAWAAPPAALGQQVVKIAVGPPLTGPLAKHGQEVANAVKLAVEEWNKRGGVAGKKIEVLEADDQGTPQVGVAAAEKVAADPAVLGVVYGITSVTCIPSSEIFEKVNLVMISPGYTNPKVTDLGSALGGAGGVLVSLYYTQIDFFMGYSAGLKAFTAAVLGGIGNIRGAMLGGIALGLAESLAVTLMNPAYKDVIAFAILILTLVFRPGGLLGESLPESEEA